MIWEERSDKGTRKVMSNIGEEEAEGRKEGVESQVMLEKEEDEGRKGWSHE